MFKQTKQKPIGYSTVTLYHPNKALFVLISTYYYNNFNHYTEYPNNYLFRESKFLITKAIKVESL